MEINSIRFSVKVWVTSIFAAPIIAWLYGLTHMLLTSNFKGDFRAAIAWTFSITLYGLLFSIPSFLIFSTINHFLAKRNMSIVLQKLIMGLVVTILIFATLLIYPEFNRSLLTGLLVASPFWLSAIIAIIIYKTNSIRGLKSNDTGKLKQATSP